MIKKIFIFLLIGICFFSFKKDTLAIWLQGASVGYTEGSYTVVSTSWCPAWTSQDCNRGSSSSNCGTGFCSSDSSSCCSQASNWTKNRRICVRTGSYNTYSYTTAWGKYSNQCSLADKQIGSEPGLRAGYCACGSYSGNIYKYCCDAAGNPEQPIKSWSDDDGVYPPEKDCPGGYAIDGDRVRSVPCTPNCVPNCAATDGGHCWGEAYAGNCGQTCTGNIGPSCGDTNAYCSGTPYGSASGCGSCTGTRPAVTGTNGNCGGSNGGTFNYNSPPASGLCNSGTATGVINDGGTTYYWNCNGTAGDCSGANGSTANCWAVRNVPPTFTSIVVKNNVGTAVAVESGNVNQICQTEFNGARTVNLTVNATDANGVGTIGDIQLRWNGINFTRTGLANGVATFNHTFAAGENTTGATDFQVYISDGVNATGWITTGRSLKVWNCNVSVSGKLYDGGASGNCSVAADYSTPAKDTNFKTLDFTDSPDMNMNKISESEYSGNLTWGKNYTAIFNSVDSDLAMQINGSGVKTTDVSANTTSCPNSLAFTLNNAVLNPYSASPTLKVDFSGVVDQDSWYQTMGGGLMANTRITNRVPVTCTTANCAMSISSGTNTNGVVASQSINNTGNSGIKKGYPNNWSVIKPLVSNLKSDYTYFLNQYFWKNGIGTTFNGDKNLSDIGVTGVIFINGDLTINVGNTVPVGSFLMMVVSGDINVDPSVTNMEGVLVAKNFNIGGSNATALTINGMIKATGTVNVNRTFVNKRANNTAAAVNFVYRPDFIFNMPGAIAKQLVKWQWGN